LKRLAILTGAELVQLEGDKSMNELNSTKALVKSILEKDEVARNSDSFLYLVVIHTIADQKKGEVPPPSKITVTDFLLNMSRWGFPPFESVRRTRQKIQAILPELGCSPAARRRRSKGVVAYTNYALDREGN
jgi:hypothetical protein